MLTRPQAEQLTAAIIDGITSVHALIKEAYDGKAHEALGYTSWPAYVEARFPLRTRTLPRQERMELVMELRSEGMSTRAIAPVVGASHTTVENDLRSTGNNLPDEVVSLDGRTRPATRPRRSLQVPTEERANRDITAWLPVLRSFNEDFAGARLMATLTVTGDTRVELVRMLHALQHNINQVLTVIDFTREETT